MSILTAAEVADLQALQAESLTGSASILRSTATPDGMGGQTVGWATAATVSCRIMPATRASSMKFAVTAGMPQETMMWMVVLPAGTDVRVADRLQIGGLAYEVSAVQGPRTYETGRMCLCWQR